MWEEVFQLVCSALDGLSREGNGSKRDGEISTSLVIQDRLGLSSYEKKVAFFAVV